MKKYVVLGVVLLAFFVSASSAKALTPIQGVGDADLTVGSTGTFVSNLQQVLINEGFLVMPTGVNLGHFGQLTKTAVIKYQVAHGISPTGYVGPVTRAKLNGNVSTTNAVTVLTPNGGESWEINTDENITWRLANQGPDSKVDLYLDGNTCEGICPAIYFEPIVLDRNISGNSYSWIVGTDIVNNPIPARDYKLKICLAGTNTCDFSDRPFNLVNENAVRVTSPNGNEEWKEGLRKTIRWESNELVDHVSITVVSSGPTCAACSLPAPVLQVTNVRNSGSYRWKIPDPAVGDYSILISGYDELNNEVGRDSSDAPFTIIAN